MREKRQRKLGPPLSMQREFGSADCLQVAPLTARSIEPLHRRDHADNQQRDQQDQTDVLDRALAPLALERGADASGATNEERLNVCSEPVEHRLLLFGISVDARPDRVTGPDLDETACHRPCE